MPHVFIDAHVYFTFAYSWLWSLKLSRYWPFMFKSRIGPAIGLLISKPERRTEVLISPYPTRKETSYSDRRFWFWYILLIIIIGGILIIFIHITRLASKEIFSPSNKIYREVVRAKDLSARLIRDLPIRIWTGCKFSTQLFGSFTQMLR